LMMSDVIRLRTVVFENSELLIKPNPASSFATLHFNSELTGKATLKITDNAGQVVAIQKENVAKGKNSLEISNLSRLGNGIYSVQLIINNEIYTVKLVIAR